jgi:D-arabinono-1,4-lactone oxidase/FAD binding domain
MRGAIIRRKAWRNDTGNQEIYPLRQEEPTSLEDLRTIVREAEQSTGTARAVGSAHSWSDVALTDGTLVKPTGLTGPLDLETQLLRVDETDPTSGTTLVRVKSGTTIAQLNADLHKRKLALPNMGGFDGQTIAGVISTSTHGSGIDFGPLSDLIRSIDVVGAGGVVYRIEPYEGPTDPEPYRAAHPEHELKQDDAWFRAVVVGMGCMGLIHSVILGVRAMFYLRERRSMSTWSQVRTRIATRGALEKSLHYEVYFNPYRRPDGEIECLETTREIVDPSEYRRDHRRSRSLLMELVARFPLTPLLINLIVGLRPKISPLLIKQALKALVNDDYVNISYRVFNIGAANYLPAYSCEIGVPIDERRLHLAAVERIADVATERAKLGGVYHSSPISLRFVKASDAHMSMMQGRDTMMIELIMTTHTIGGMELLAAHEAALYALGGRPHWGQVNWLTGSDGLIDSMYPQLDNWQAVHAQINASGVFDSPFSKRVGLSRSVYSP